MQPEALLMLLAALALERFLVWLEGGGAPLCWCRGWPSAGHAW
ncbi:hypothetical protein AAF143_08630 [Cyanobium sp. ATX-6F1]